MQMRFNGPMVLSPEILYSFVYILIPALLLGKVKVLPKKTYASDFISKDNTNLLRGFCVLLILIHHFSQQLFDVSYLRPFKYIGVFAVALFFFLSAYGMTVSVSNNPNYLRHFLFKRFSKIYVPYLIINSITVIIMTAFYNASYTFPDIVLLISGVKLVDASLWFVHRILIYYIVFYLAFRFFSKKTASVLIFIFTIIYCVICFKLGRGVWEFRTAFAFPLGIFFCLYRNRIFRFVSENYVRVTALCLLCFISTTYLYYADILPLATSALAAAFFICQTLLFLMKIRISSVPFSLLGNISYEVYLIHMKVLVVAYSLDHITSSSFLYIYIGIAVIAAYLFNRLLRLNTRSKGSLPQITLNRAIKTADETAADVLTPSMNT
jgi:membrane-bound acyltransferase YfiQ involved in biofilm formation